MAELDEKTKNEPESPVEEKIIEKAMKPVNKSLINLDKAIEPDSETSSLAPDDDETLANSTTELKVKVPRKLMEDERRATGRISTAVWMTYFRVSLADMIHDKDKADNRPLVGNSGVCRLGTYISIMTDE
jgi:hypothetical protein